MIWLNLTPIEFAAVFSVTAAAAVWLYLLHQLPRRRVVSTLRFWESVQPAAVPRRRKRIQHPWALLAQLLFLMLLVLALANLRRNAFGAPDRSVVLMVDGSVWSQVQPDGEKPWIEQVRRRALREIDQLSDGDRVALVRTDNLAEMLVPFTTDRALLRKAIRQLRPSDTASDLPRALEYGQSALAGQPRPALVYVGPGMVDEQQRARLGAFRKAIHSGDPGNRPRLVLRTIGQQSIENRGVTRLAVRRDPEHPATWHLLAQIKNYSDRAAPVGLRVSIDGRQVEEREVSLAPHELTNSHADFEAADGGMLEAAIAAGDALAADDRAVAYLPAFRPVQVAVVTRDPKMLQPMLAANPYVRTEFVQPGAAPVTPPDVTIYDSPAVGQASTVAGGPGQEGSQAGISAPLASANSIQFLRGSRTQELRLTAWNAQHPVTKWIRTRDVTVRSSTQLTASPSDTVLAWAGNEPLVMARQQDGRKSLLLGFDPRQSNLPLQPAFPLLIAASIEWMTHAVEEGGDSAVSGALSVSNAADEVLAADGSSVPFARGDSGLQMLATRAGVYNVRLAGSVTPVAVNVPPLPGQRWVDEDEDDAEAGEDAPPPSTPPQHYWRLFAMLALLPLWAEWMLYYRRDTKIEAQSQGKTGHRAAPLAWPVTPPGDSRVSAADDTETRRAA